MKVHTTEINDCKIIEPDVFYDDRGFFLETFQVHRYKEVAGIDLDFVQDNSSYSKCGTLRGLHFQKKKPQGKLIRVISGAIIDVAVDLRKESTTYGKHIKIELSDKNNFQLWVPPRFAHGFLVVSDHAHVAYKCTDYYDPEDEEGIVWNDNTLNICWPDNIQIKISPKDSAAGTFEDYDNV